MLPCRVQLHHLLDRVPLIEVQVEQRLGNERTRPWVRGAGVGVDDSVRVDVIAEIVSLIGVVRIDVQVARVAGVWNVVARALFGEVELIVAPDVGAGHASSVVCDC